MDRRVVRTNINELERHVDHVCISVSVGNLNLARFRTVSNRGSVDHDVGGYGMVGAEIKMMME